MAEGPTSTQPGPGSDALGFHDLVRQAQEGDRKAMDQVLEVLRPLLEPLAHRYADPTKPVESTADLLQESCLRAWNKIDTFQGGQSDEETFAMFRAWVGQIVRRLGLDAKRNQGRQRRQPKQKLLRLDRPRQGDSTSSGASMQPVAREGTPSTYVRADEREERIREALKDLPDETNAVIVRMYVFDELGFAEIGERLGISDDAARLRYWATIEDLHHRLKGLI